MQARAQAAPNDQKVDPVEAERKRLEQEEARRVMLRTLLQPAAIERLRRIELVKPAKARSIENHLIQNGSRLAGGEMISEEQLVSLLTQIDASSGRGPTVKIDRRKRGGDDSDDEW